MLKRGAKLNEHLDGQAETYAILSIADSWLIHLHANSPASSSSNTRAFTALVTILALFLVPFFMLSTLHENNKEPLNTFFLYFPPGREL